MAHMSPRQVAPFSIEYALLGLLREQPLHGYDLYQRLLAPQALGAIWPLKRAHFYAHLTKLEQAGYLTRETAPQENTPPRQMLHLTDDGAAAFAAWLHSPTAHTADMQRDLLARLYFARRSGTTAAVLTQQRATSQRERDDLRRHLAGLPDLTSFPALTLHWRLRQVEAVLAWLDIHAAPSTDGALVAYPIAPLRDSQNPALAQQFVEYVCAPAGQRVLRRHGFLTADASPVEEEHLPAQPARATPVPRTLTVYAAASLTGAFRELGRQFEAAHPGTRVSLQFAGSHSLAQQIVSGAPADVFVAAHRVPLEHVIAAGRILTECVQVCTHNRLAVATTRRNTAPPLALADLAQPGRRLVVGSDATAVGHYALDLLDHSEQTGDLGARGRLAVLQNVVDYADTPNAIVAQLLAGEADVGIVFASDCASVADQIVSPLIYPAVLPWGAS
jgi:molybdenum ABC transporter molybdate-binding protein